MEKQIFDIIRSYQDSNRDIDFNFIAEIISLASKYYELNDYVLNVESCEYIYSCAQYNLITKEIYVNPNSINKVLVLLTNKFEKLKHNKQFYYLFTVKNLLHEIEHVYQQKKIREFDDIEGAILRAEYNPVYDIVQNNTLLKIPKIIYHNKLKDKYYIYSPSERLAEDVACKQTQKLTLFMNDEESHDIIKHFKYRNILRGYNVGLRNDLSYNPTKTYLEKINPGYDYSIIDGLATGMNQYDKIRLGLEVDKMELNKTAQEWEKVYKKNKK